MQLDISHCTVVPLSKQKRLQRLSDKSSTLAV